MMKSSPDNCYNHFIKGYYKDLEADNMRTYEDFTEAYLSLLEEVYTKYEHECSPRDLKIREKLGVTFKVINPLNRLAYVPERGFSVSYVIAEMLWYLSGNDSTEWISNYSSFWSKISDDGVTANSAYGARIFKPHSRAGDASPWTQWMYVINELATDNDSRRAVIHIRSPLDSLFAKLDVPCTLTLQFFLRDDKLHQVASMRSSDLILGLVYDVPAFTLFQEILAIKLSNRLNRKIEMGTYTHISNSLHIYSRHYPMVQNILRANYSRLINKPKMPEIKSKDPFGEVNKLVVFESSVRSIQDATLLNENLLTTLDTNDEYWKDWARILMSHRAEKLQDVKAQRTLLDSCHFKGYSKFER
jgi:thymidylate synthase